MPTTEWYNGQRQVISSGFRAYDSLNASVEDHNKLLSFARYEAVRGCTDYREACERVYQCGYAADPDYPGKLIRIIEENRLYEFDNPQNMEEVAVDATMAR